MNAKNTIKILISSLALLFTATIATHVQAASRHDSNCINVKIHNYTLSHGGAQIVHLTVLNNGSVRKKNLNVDKTTDIELCSGSGNYIEGANYHGDTCVCFGDGCENVPVYDGGDKFTFADTEGNMQQHGECALYANFASSEIYCHDWSHIEK